MFIAWFFSLREVVLGRFAPLLVTVHLMSFSINLNDLLFSFSCLRAIAKICAKERKKIFASGGDDQHPMVVHLNLIICLVAKYFGQQDLAD